MHERDFVAFRQDLLRSGIAPRVAERATRELSDHFADLVEELRDRGAGETTAQRRAAAALGPLEDIVAAMASRRELKVWPRRYPYIAIVFYPLACLAALPAVPVIAGAAHAPLLARWGTSFVAAGVLTSSLLLLLQLLILFG